MTWYASVSSGWAVGGVGNLIDPVKRLNDAAANDPESLRLGTLATTWYAEFVSAPQLLKSVVNKSSMEDILKEVAQDRRGAINAKMLAAYLGKRLGKIVNGYRFERQNGRSKTSQWRVVQLTGGGGGIGGFGGAISAHAANNINSSSDNLSSQTGTEVAPLV